MDWFVVVSVVCLLLGVAAHMNMLFERNTVVHHGVLLAVCVSFYGAAVGLVVLSALAVI